MAKMPDEHELEQYLAGTLSAGRRQRVEAALAESQELRTCLAELKHEQQTVETVKDSFAVRLTEDEEERIISKSVDRLRTSLTDGGQCDV